MFKRFLLWASALVFTFSVFCLITFGVLSSIIRPNHLKKWVTSSGVYTKFPGVIINQAASAQIEDKTRDDGLSLKTDGARQAAEQALTPAFFQTSTEQVIDGTFSWLDAKTTKPTFNINVLEVKQNYVDNLGDYLKKRYEALPSCPEGVLPNSTDLLKINCRPGDNVLDIDQVISSQKLGILQDQNFLGENSITADNLGSNDDKDASNKQEVFDQKVIPNIYRWFRLSPAIFGGLALLSGVFVVALCEVKKFGVRKLGWRFVVAGSLALGATCIGVFGLVKLTNLINSQPSRSEVAPFKSIITPVIGAARAEVLVFSLAASLLSVAVGLMVLLATRSVSKKSRRSIAATKKITDVTNQNKPTTEQPKPAPDEPSTAPEVPTPPVAKPRARKPPLIQ